MSSLASQPNDCLLNRLFRRRSKKTSKPRVTGLCAGNSPGTGEFPAQRASNAANVSICLLHHAHRLVRKDKVDKVCVTGNDDVERRLTRWYLKLYATHFYQNIFFSNTLTIWCIARNLLKIIISFPGQISIITLNISLCSSGTGPSSFGAGQLDKLVIDESWIGSGSDITPGIAFTNRD